MLQESILRLYRRLRLDGYRKLFGAVQEREGSLSAIEAFSADLIHLLGEPTLSQFAEYVGISQPNATYKVNALAGKGYVEKVVSKPDRREIRPGPERSLHSILTKTARQSAPRQSGCARSFPKAKSTRRAACLTQCWMQCRRAGKEPMYD